MYLCVFVCHSNLEFIISLYFFLYPFQISTCIDFISLTNKPDVTYYFFGQSPCYCNTLYMIMKQLI